VLKIYQIIFFLTIRRIKTCILPSLSLRIAAGLQLTPKSFSYHCYRDFSCTSGTATPIWRQSHQQCLQIHCYNSGYRAPGNRCSGLRCWNLHRRSAWLPPDA